MEAFPKNWKLFEVNFDGTKWDFLVDGGMHSVFSTSSNIKLNFGKCLQNNQFSFSEMSNPTVISIFNEKENQIFDDFEIIMSYFILKIEKKSTTVIEDVINKILFEFGLNKTQLSKYIISPRVPLIFIQKNLFRLGWFEPNSSIINIPILPLNACGLHTKSARHFFNLEFKPKCVLPLLIGDFTLYRVLQKLIKDNSWIICTSGVTQEKIDQEFELLLRFKRSCGIKDIPCQISIQKLPKDEDFENVYSPTNLFFSNSKDQVFSEFLKALKISGKVIQNNSITHFNHLLKNCRFTELIQNEIPIFSEALSHFSQVFHNLIFCQTFCAGQQILAYYLYNVLKFIIPINDIKKLINTQTMHISTKIEELSSSSSSSLMNIEFYHDKAIENFQFGLLYLTKLVFHVKRNSLNKKKFNKNTKEVVNVDREFSYAVQNSTLWLSKYFFGRSVCDCSLIIAILYTNQNSLPLNYSDFKLIKTINSDYKSTFNSNQESYNMEHSKVWARIKVIDISNKPLEKIDCWKSQFLNLVEKLLLINCKNTKRQN
ncbi:uncharacterized protein ELE39_002228 [Cryptosporidium sp. chipmunk genotype I]|uniref:uncharacterized protein n=1 Tax=Cryptosporidium sp. chipmunk genotype I TaxID=1280935 RepID=UPI003519F545|nr:hypothetical protein ELE39_002228 [Cryptosporidium sp. chipmunk genotype I]